MRSSNFVVHVRRCLKAPSTKVDRDPAGASTEGVSQHERSAAEMRGLLRFAQGLGLDEATVREIYGAVGRKAMATGASDDNRMAEVRKRMLLAVN